MPRKSKTSWFRTHEGFASVISFSTILLAILLITMWVIFDKNKDSSFGISPPMFTYIGASLSPHVLVTLSSFWNVLLSVGGLRERGKANKRKVVIFDRVEIYYVVCFLLFICVAVSILLIANHLDETKAKVIVQILSAFWALTIGRILTRFFKDYAEPVPTQTAPQAPAQPAE